MNAYQQIDSRPVTGHQKSLIGLVVLGNLAEFFDMFLIGFVVSLLTTPWHLTGFEAGTILACAGLGTVLGSILWGRLADRIGRRRSFAACVLLFVGFTALCLLVPDRGWALLALLRVGVGIGVGGLNITSIPYVQEFVPARQRGLLAGLASVFIPAGLLLGSLAQRAVGDHWRVLVALGCLPVLLLLWVRRVPESPRFLQEQGQEGQARAALAWALEIPEAEVAPLPPVRDDGPRRAAYRTLFREHLRPLVVVGLGSFCFILGGFAIQSWGQSLLKDAFGYSVGTVATLFLLVSVADLLGRLASAWLADALGRRPTLLLFGLLGAAGCVLAAFSGSSGLLFFLGLLVTMAFGDGAFGILNAFGAEQFPTAVRSTGLGLGYGIGATAKIIGPALMGAMIGGNLVSQDVTRAVITPAFLFFGACLLLGALVYQFAREAKGAELD